MNIGIPKETFQAENRLALSPLAVKTLTQSGHAVYLEAGAGDVSFYDDSNYAENGAQIVYDADEAFGRAQLIAKVERPSGKELEMMHEGQVLMSFLQPAAADPALMNHLIDNRICAIGYEIIRNNDGTLPIVRSMSEICGNMAVSTAARLLESQAGGRGMLLCGAPGVPPAEVVIIGAGNVGCTVAKAAVNAGASVTILDKDVEALREVRNKVSGPVVTSVATPEHIELALAYADVLITAIRIPHGGKVRHVVTREQVKRMKNGAVIIDTAIDQGGSVETSRPTTLDAPTYVAEGVLHYCVPNMSSAVPRTASRVLADSVLPYILEIADEGLDVALKGNAPLARAVFTYDGHCCNEQIADLFNLKYTPIEKLLK